MNSAEAHNITEVIPTGGFLERQLGNSIFQEFGHLAEMEAKTAVSIRGIRDQVANNILMAGELQRMSWKPEKLLSTAVENVMSQSVYDIPDEVWEAAKRLASAKILEVRDTVGDRFKEAVDKMDRTG